MAESIYSQIGKVVGKDVRQVRAVAHHPFEFFSKLMEDPKDHRPIRFRYLGAFFVKPHWRKGLRNTAKVGLPPDGANIWARVPETVRGKEYINLKHGAVVNRGFKSDDGKVHIPVDEVKFWVKSSKVEELS